MGSIAARGSIKRTAKKRVELPRKDVKCPATKGGGGKHRTMKGGLSKTAHSYTEGGGLR